MRRTRRGDAGEMLVLMAGVTVTLLGIAGALLWILGRPSLPPGPAATRQVLLAGAVELRDQLLQKQSTDRETICAEVVKAARDNGIEVSRCRLVAGLLTVEAVGRHGEILTAQAEVTPDAAGCQEIRTSWGEVLTARCPAAEGSTTEKET